MHATPAGLAVIQHELGIDTRLKFVRPCVWLRGPHPQNAQAAVTGRPGLEVRTDSPISPPSANQALGPAVAPVLGKWPVWLQRAQQNRQPGNAGECVTHSS
jgi:hypothetical protein